MGYLDPNLEIQTENQTKTFQGVTLIRYTGVSHMDFKWVFTTSL